jgi:signal transduction histidine kinase
MNADLILFVEDNPDFRDSAANLMEMNGFEVLVASDGMEALNLLKTIPRKPDVIISDILMPRMDGYEFFHAVHDQGHLRDIPFIFLTALDANAQIRLGWEIGVDQYIVKPFKPEDFLAVLRNRLNRSRELQQIIDNRIEETRHSLVKILSHELRTPLTYVTGGFGLLAEELSHQGETGNGARRDISEILNLIHIGTTRLNRLAEQTVLLSELMSGQSKRLWETAREPLALADILSMTLENVGGLAADKSIALELDVAPQVFVSGVRELLERGATEVVRNAIQYSEPRQVVYVTTYSQNGMGVIEVRDQGRGIRHEDLEKAWELMSQSERDHYEQQGFGLGLPITRCIMQVHEGSAEMASKVGVGTTVWLRVPLCR